MVVGQGSGSRATKEGAVALETLAAAQANGWRGGAGIGGGGRAARRGNVGSSLGRAAVALGGCAVGQQVPGRR